MPQHLTLLHSERPKLHTILVFLSAVGSELIHLAYFGITAAIAPEFHMEHNGKQTFRSVKIVMIENSLLPPQLKNSKINFS